MHDVFLSYAHEDKEFATNLARDLAAEGLSVWFDEFELLPGDVISNRVGSALRNTKDFIAIVSKSSVESNWFNTELATAIAASEADSSRKIIPIIKDLGARLPPFLRQRQFIEMHDKLSYENGLERLVASLRTRDDESASSVTGHVKDTNFDLAKIAMDQLALERAYHDFETEFRNRHYASRIRSQGLLALIASLIGIAGALIAFSAFPGFPFGLDSRYADYFEFIAGVLAGVMFSVVLKSLRQSMSQSERSDKID